ncbi:hypothetical protein CCH79_00000193 [Gambusia affinis]|uniref:High mobility group nucleosome-binding domain-containing protein 3 n=1 Tax=Gambusia affinis TaxID=33528 RepID=A0A315VWN6_GAMAF|nr:hypothetical protein CCH79_00000193 [Gambusia affinis]
MPLLRTVANSPMEERCSDEVLKVECWKNPQRVLRVRKPLKSQSKSVTEARGFRVHSSTLSAVGKPAPNLLVFHCDRVTDLSFEKPAPPKAEVKPKKTVVKKDEKGPKAKKGGAKGKKEDGPAQNGETKANEV